MADIKKVISWLADTELYYQQEGSESHDSDHQCRMAHATISVIEELQTENERLRQPKWTYASEGMPRYECYGKKYWVYTQYRKSSGEVGGRKVELLRWEQTTIRGKTVERFKTLWDAIVYDDIIAWMPLSVPQPPKEGDVDGNH